MQEASDTLSKTADSDTVSTYQVSSVWFSSCFDFNNFIHYFYYFGYLVGYCAANKLLFLELQLKFSFIVG